MDPDSSPPVKLFIPAALILSLLGWGGLFLVVVFTLPTVAPRWLFFFLTVTTCTALALPAAAFLNRRFPSTPPATPIIILRQALWVGIYVPVLLWLRIPRVLTPALALLLALGLGMIEFLLRLRERSLRKS
jgi:hypothetical protein